MRHSGDECCFVPLPCSESCLSHETYSVHASLPADGNVPCGVCLTLDVTNGSTITFEEGLNVEGQLILPPDANLTIRMPFLVVQGEFIADFLTMSTVGADPKVKIVLIGSNKNDNHNVTDIIHPMNRPACAARGGKGCSIGKKAVAIVGGKMTVRGLPEPCKTWDWIEDVVAAAPPATVSGSFSSVGVSDTVGTASCPSRTLLYETFDARKNGWTGKSKAEL